MNSFLLQWKGVPESVKPLAIYTTSWTLHDRQILASAVYIVFKETSNYWSVQSFSVFHWSPLISKPRMTLVFFVKTTESYKVSFVTCNRQTSYDSGILRQDSGIIQGLPIGFHLGRTFNEH